MKHKINFLSSVTKMFLCLAVALFFTSCEEWYEYDLPEANSKVDTVLPSANFTYIPNANDFTTIEFKNLSFESTKYLWDFGTGDTSTKQDPVYTFKDGEGTYPVTLTASDENGASSTVTINVEVIDRFVAIQPEIINGDFEAGTDGWKFSKFTGGTTNPFNTSSDGSPLNYDGTSTSSKTAGAKWTKATSAGAYLSSNTRYAYQAIVVSPNTEYVLEYEYSIKTEAEQAGVAPGGNRIIGGILDGHFEDGAEAIPKFDAVPLVSHIGTEVLGKGVFTIVQTEFTSNAKGEVAILIYAVTDVDAYVDNVKVYPKK